jgi:hypothetical protein
MEAWSFKSRLAFALFVCLLCLFRLPGRLRVCLTVCLTVCPTVRLPVCLTICRQYQAARQLGS